MFLTTPTAVLRDRMARELAEVGAAAVLMAKYAGDATKVHALSGELQFSSSGWGLLKIPNALVRGAFDALDEAGAELPLKNGRLNAHISVLRPEDIEQIGGADKVKEFGHHFSYSLGPVKEVEPAGWATMSKVWFIECSSPELQALRKSYGLTGLPKDDKHPFHITIGVRRKHILRNNEVRKHASADDVDPEIEAEIEKFKAEKKYLGRYKCPHCGGTNLYNGIPGTGTTFRGSGHCTDCDKGCSIVGLKLKRIGDGPELVSTDDQLESYRKRRKWEKAQEKERESEKEADAKITAIKPVTEIKAPEGECCPSCGARLERDPYSGTCNSCGKPWPEKKAVHIPKGGTVAYDYHCTPCDHSFDGNEGKCPVCNHDRRHTGKEAAADRLADLFKVAAMPIAPNSYGSKATKDMKPKRKFSFNGMPEPTPIDKIARLASLLNI